MRRIKLAGGGRGGGAVGGRRGVGEGVEEMFRKKRNPSCMRHCLKETQLIKVTISYLYF